MCDILVRDHFKAMSDRAIKPTDIGGVAGVRLHYYIRASYYHAPKEHTPKVSLFANSLFASSLTTPQGTKYIWDNLLFKFSFPSSDSPYLGSYELSNKAAGHDLRGAITIYHAIEAVRVDKPILNLHVNLMAIVDHLGE